MIQIGFTFLVLAYPDSPRKGANKRVCVCHTMIFNVCGSGEPGLVGWFFLWLFQKQTFGNNWQESRLAWKKICHAVNSVKTLKGIPGIDTDQGKLPFLDSPSNRFWKECCFLNASYLSCCMPVASLSIIFNVLLKNSIIYLACISLLSVYSVCICLLRVIN